MHRDQWQEVIDQGYRLPEGVSLHEATRELLDFLSSTDPFLRDRVGYFTLSNWIERGLYTPAECQGLLEWALHNLNLGLGTSLHDSVFLRAFSVLLVSELVALDITVPFLTPAERDHALQATLQYLSGECDLRGHVPEKGWAHAVAHGADALEVFARHPGTSAAQKEQLLDTVLDLALMEQVYLYNEEARLARAAHALLKAEPATALQDRLQQAFTQRMTPDWYTSAEQAAVRLNAKGFLHSLLTLDLEEEVPALQSWLLGLLKALD